MNTKLLEQLYNKFETAYQDRITEIITLIVEAVEKDRKICVVTGSGPNIHEGVTTLIAELINKKIITGGVLTSSAVIAHEMAGALDRVKRIQTQPEELACDMITCLPRGDIFELTVMTDEEYEALTSEREIEVELIERLKTMEGTEIIKAAGNMAYPMGLRTEQLAEEILTWANELGNRFSLEYLAGLGADPMRMIGAGAANDVPVLVSVPQMVGGGAVGLCIGDSISVHTRSKRNAEILAGSQVIIESALALAQEIHDGPFETYTGHGIWANWEGEFAYSLQNKHLVRFDLDPNLEVVWQNERKSSTVQEAINKGLPKTKLTGVPFRMEMSGFARLESSVPVVGDIGEIWPIVAYNVAKDLGIELDFLSYPQETKEGQEMRDFIVKNVKPIDYARLKEKIEELR